MSNNFAAPSATILVLNGPNLNLLGTREPGHYGRQTLSEIVAELEQAAAELQPPVAIVHRQSNHEGELVDAIQQIGASAQGIIINPGAFTHYSIALRDALSAIGTPTVEVHISNIHARDELHRHSKLSAAVTSVICGLGPYGYIVAMQAAVRSVGKLPSSLPAPIATGPV